MGTDRDGVEGLLEKAVEAIVEAASPERVVLFGSHARGEAGPNSDMDFLVITRPGRHRRDTAKAIYRRLSKIGYAVDIVVVTVDDVALHRDSPGLVISKALDEGVDVYAA